jgi:outer membrane protein OmpA-like peptidoglycan-associated protein
MFSCKNNKSHDEDHWLSVSDLMAGLMMVFLFISVALMRETIKEKDNMKNIAVTYQNTQVAIYNALNQEFKEELGKWDAKIDKKTLTFTFKSPKTLFDNNKAELKLKYKEILKDFFPRYLSIILKFKDSIREIRIEGHTSSLGTYFHNMKLSQDRTRSVLQYIYNLKEVKNSKQWIKMHISAVGLSSSRLVLKNGKEDITASRRVGFKIITNSEIQIRKILEIK